jgi:hypothetical protein
MEDTMPGGKKKLKILAVGDIHGDKRLTKKLAEKAEQENVDLVILAGDLTTFESSLEGIIGPFVKAGKEILIIPGNHESPETIQILASLYPNTKSLHGYYIKKGNVGIFGAGLANIGGYTIDESELFSLLKRSHEKIKEMEKKLMVTHMHPEGTIMEKVTSFVPPSTAVRKAIERFQPDIAICGHVHEAAGLEDQIGKTRVINVSRKEKIFEL